MRKYDKIAIDNLCIPSIVLMENAGRGAADFIKQLLNTCKKENPKVAVVCGMGNNGGDGFVVARQLAGKAYINVFYTDSGSNFTKDAAINYNILAATRVSIHKLKLDADDTFEKHITEADFIVDAIFGTGLTREVSGIYSQVIQKINNTNACKISLDICSGLNANTGEIFGVAVKADYTITFAHPKQGLFTPQGKDYTGKIHTVHLGFDDSIILKEVGTAARLLKKEDIASFFIPRSAKTYKHRAGDILVVGGSTGKTGAPKLTAIAALRSGAGLSTILTWTECLNTQGTNTDEIMWMELNRKNLKESILNALQKRASIAVGPGLGLDADAHKTLEIILSNADVPVILDADALTLLATGAEILKKSHPKKILTPHSKELARLLGKTVLEIEADRFASVKEAAQKTNAVVVLKGAHTLIQEPNGACFVSPFANPVLATAGSGDTLTGIIAALASHLSPLEAACAGVFLHAYTAHEWTRIHKSDRGLVASDIAKLLPQTIGKFLTREAILRERTGIIF